MQVIVVRAASGGNQPIPQPEGDSGALGSEGAADGVTAGTIQLTALGGSLNSGLLVTVP